MKVKVKFKVGDGCGLKSNATTERSLSIYIIFEILALVIESYISNIDINVI